jgi:hypothetical protein
MERRKYYARNSPRGTKLDQEAYLLHATGAKAKHQKVTLPLARRSNPACPFRVSLPSQVTTTA